MKNIKSYSVVILLLFTMSCSEFLVEESKLTKTEDLVYSNANAVDGLIAACYSYTRMWYGHEMAIYLTEGGTDLWYPGRDGQTSPAGELSTYNQLKADMGTYDEMWEVLYNAVNTCNTAESVLNKDEFFTGAEKNQRLAEVLFMRAFYYWHLVETWGPVQLNLEPASAPAILFTRDTEEAIYTQMFKDVQFAIDNLDPSAAPSSRVTWLAAKAFKARLALYWASPYHGNTDYYAIAAQEAKDVIAAGSGLGKSLYDDYSDVWDQTKGSTSLNAEFIWAIDYFNTIESSIRWSDVPFRLQGNGSWNKVYTRADGAGQGNTMHLFWAPIWNNQNTATGGPGQGVLDVLVRTTGAQQFYTAASPAEKITVNVDQYYVKYSMGYTRMGPTKYCLDLFDETMDERWDVTFRSAWYKHPDVVPKYWPSDSCLYPKMTSGTATDTAMLFCKRELTQAQKDWAEGRYKAMDITSQFDADGVPTPGTSDGGAVMFNYMRKWEDTQSTLPDQVNFNDYFSNRDFPVFRLAEMYLIAAEAQISSDQTDALRLVNELREKRAIAGHEADMRVASVDIDLILAERAREFTAEDVRWFDLKRTLKLEEQVQNNPTARDFFDPNKHYLRPIPTVQIQASSNFDDPNLQNPNY